MHLKNLENYQNILKALNAGCDCIFICNNREKVIDIIDRCIKKVLLEISNKIVKLSKKRLWCKLNIFS